MRRSEPGEQGNPPVRRGARIAVLASLASLCALASPARARLARENGSGGSGGGGTASGGKGRRRPQCRLGGQRRFRLARGYGRNDGRRLRWDRCRRHRRKWFSPRWTAASPLPGSAPIRRLTRFEYSNVARDLLADATSPGNQLPPELKGNGFSNDALSLTTPRLLVDAYQSVAQDVAARATKDAATLLKTTSCDTTKMSETACAQSFITNFGTRAFRRPLDSTESTAMLGVYNAVRPTSTYADAIAAVIEMVLQSPQFLYRPEFGVPVSGNSSVVRMSGYEMATRLSFLFWGTVPNQTLLDAAKAGTLDTKDQVLMQATRMIADPKTKDVAHFFHDTWLGINAIDNTPRDATWFPNYTPDLAALFRQETEQFMDYVIWQGKGDLATIYTGPITFVNGPLSKFYGFGDVTGDAFQMVTTDGTRRAGDSEPGQHPFGHDAGISQQPRRAGEVHLHQATLRNCSRSACGTGDNRADL